MDKETLSNYGWIVIAVLVLAVMIALATPFGTFIENGIKSTTQGLFDVEQKALGAASIIIPDQEFEGSNGGSAPSTPTKDPALNPDDGTTPQNGDTYEYGDYIYTYHLHKEMEYDIGWQVDLNTAVTDTNQTSYGAILESINGEPVTSMYGTFGFCKFLTDDGIPTIPSGVTNMSHTFSSCESLKDLSSLVIPSSVIYMQNTFQNCTALVTAPAIPNSVTEMWGVFNYCTSLVTAPDMSNATSVTTIARTFWGCTALVDLSDFSIPSSVTDMEDTFWGCTSLVTAPAIPDGVTKMYSTFYGCTALVGTIEIPIACQGQNIGYSNVIYK